MRARLIIVLAMCCLLMTCGINKNLQPEQKETAKIRNFTWKNNTISFTTHRYTTNKKTPIDSTYISMYVTMTITARDNSEYFIGWTAGEMTYNHEYSLPLTVNKTYTIKLTVENIFAKKDTTFVYTPRAISQSLLKVHYINVQQGDGILIETPESKRLQIDGGYGRRGDGSAWQGGRQPLALYYLQSQNIEYLDYIIESHHHADHYGGLLDITASTSGITYDIYLSPSQNHSYTSGASLTLDSEVGFTFFNIGYPPGYNGDDLNNSSIVLKAVYGDAEFLFTGDAMGPVQNWMYSQNYDLSVDVLKVSHHGADSNNTTTGQFLDRTLNQHTRLAILSYGAGNPYGHPRSLNRFRDAQTYGTNSVTSPPSGANYHLDCGTIRVLSDGKLIFVATERG